MESLGALVIIDSFSLMFQFIAAYLGYKIYTFSRLSKWWLALIGAFVLQFIRRILSIIQDFHLINVDLLLLDRIFMFLISLLIVIGLFAMLKNFENFELIQNNVKKKLKIRN